MDVLQELQDMVAEDPTRRNEEAVYVTQDGTPSCVIAHLANRLGWPLPEFYDANNANEAIQVWPGRASVGEFALMATVQRRADLGMTWGDAIRIAGLLGYQA